MKNEPLFNRTISILVNAYLNETLIHGECQACAVGNIIANNMGYVPDMFGCGTQWIDKKTKKIIIPQWSYIFAYGILLTKNPELHLKSMHEIKMSGYSLDELMLIEKSFEDAPKPDKSGYLGLMSVCDALMEIHEANEIEINEAKALFTHA